MGGRGASSGGNSGGVGGGGSVTLSEKNSNYFNNVVKGDLKRTGEAFGNSKSDAEKQYYSDELDVKMQRYSNALNISEEQLKGMITGKTKIQIEKESPKPKSTQTQNTSRKFVNSDGEATSRYITSGTYEKASKRLTNAMNDWFKNWR